MAVRSDSAETGQSHSVVAQKLTVRERRVSSDACIRPFVVQVKEIERVDITWLEFSRLHVKVIEKSASFVHGGDICTADVRETVARLLTCVLPTVKFRHSHDILETEISLCGGLSKLLNVEILSAKSLV